MANKHMKRCAVSLCTYKDSYMNAYGNFICISQKLDSRIIY